MPVTFEQISAIIDMRIKKGEQSEVQAALNIELAFLNLAIKTFYEYVEKEEDYEVTPSRACELVRAAELCANSPYRIDLEAFEWEESDEDITETNQDGEDAIKEDNILHYPVYGYVFNGIPLDGPDKGKPVETNIPYRFDIGDFVPPPPNKMGIGGYIGHETYQYESGTPNRPYIERLYESIRPLLIEQLYMNKSDLHEIHTMD